MGNAISDVSFSNRLDLQAFVAGLSGDGHHILLARLITENKYGTQFMRAVLSCYIRQLWYRCVRANGKWPLKPYTAAPTVQ